MTIRVDALPEMAGAWDAVAAEAAAEGIEIELADFGGFRTAGDTSLILQYKQDDYNAYAARARAQGLTPVPITGAWDDDGTNRPIAPYGKSYHDYGAARDFIVSSHPDTMSTTDAVARVDAIAVAAGLSTGKGYGDSRHLQLAISLDAAKQRWAEYTGQSSSSSGGASMTAVWLLVAAGAGVLAVIRLARGLRL